MDPPLANGGTQMAGTEEAKIETMAGTEPWWRNACRVMVDRNGRS